MSKAKLEERREFLKTKVNPILEVMVADIMKASPENVVDYMEQWLKSKGRKVQAEAQKRQGNKLDG